MTTHTLTDDDHGVLAALSELGRQGNVAAANILGDHYKPEHLSAHEKWAVAKAAERRRTQAEAAERDAEQRKLAGLRGQSRVLEILKRGAGVA